ncbi:MAG: transcription-repair coupling factor, partial [Actinobacteria bacterium]|nr:transcription-repair coupling factor [Actinomycetota bacterium]
MLNLFPTLKSPIAKYLASSDDLVAPSSVHSLLAASLSQPLLIVTSSTRRSEELCAEISSLIGKDCVVNFPAWETLPHERLSPKADTVTARFKALNKITDQSAKVIVCSIRALLQPIIANNLEESKISLVNKMELSMADLILKLVEFGFTRSDLVERRGDFAVRGGILDLFPADQDHPIRLDFFGEEIDDISYFGVADQRSLEKINNNVIIFPCRELLLNEKVKQNAMKLAEEFPQLKEIIEKITQEITFEGMESLAAGLVDEFKSLIDFLPEQTQIWLVDEPRLRSRAADLITTNEEFLSAAWSNIAWSQGEKVDTPLDLSQQLGRAGFYEFYQIEDISKKAGHLIRALNLYPSTPEQIEVDFIETIETYGKKYELALNDISKWQKLNYQVVITASANGTLKRFSELLNAENLPNQFVTDGEKLLQTGLISLYRSEIAHGFKSEKYKVILITDKDISGQKTSDKDLARMPSRRRKAIDPLQLKSGDFVVHEQHGVGRYVELLNRSVGGVSREYLVIEYASSKRGQPADRLFVPTDTLEQVTKYVGGEAPALHRIGGADWQNSKRKARKAVKQIAAELIRLYAARMSSPGFAFSPDTPWQKELEDSFSFVETIDQQATIDEVKRDME